MSLVQKALGADVSSEQKNENNGNMKTNEEFTLEELDILIRVIASANFPVKEIEPLYKAIFKLQQLRNKLSQNAT